MKHETFLLIVVILLIAFAGCQNELDFTKEVLPKTRSGGASRMRFSSSEEVQTLLDQMQNGDYSSAKTKTYKSDNFLSLNEFLIQTALNSLTEEELKQIQADGLVYDPEDTLIADPNFCDLLNADREIVVEGKVYKYVQEGVLRCNISEDSLLLNLDIDLSLIKDTISNTNFIPLKNSLEFLPIDYSQHIANEVPITRSSGLGDLKLENGHIINANNVRDIEWKSRGDAGLIQHGLSSILSKNTVVESNFDKRHRMKLRMYEQNYVVARTIGMTLRMQQRRLRIWWRKKAEEFHYGWIGLELAYRFRERPIPPVHTPDWPRNEVGDSRVPDYISKKFPFDDNDIILFYVPFSNYPIKTANVNKLVSEVLNKVSSSIRNYFTGHNKQGVFTIKPYPYEHNLLVVVPQIEKHAYNDGREVYRFDTDWLSGNYTVGVQVYPNIKKANVSFKAPYKAHIARGCVYGAVKWNGKWKAARIYTSD